MTFKDISDMVCMAARASRDILQYMENTGKRNYGYLHGCRWTNIQIKDMEKKQPKRDSKGRFVKKELPSNGTRTNSAPITLGEGEVITTEAFVRKLESERDAFKILAEKYMGKYLDKCYARRQEQEDHLSCLEALGEAYKQIGWYTSKISWWKRWLLRKKMREMDKTIYRMLIRELSHDRE